jgi:hypothetical protein
MKANKVLEGKPCGNCGAPLVLGADAAVCTACQTPAHAACWDGAGGCGHEGCVNAPLAQMAAPAAGAPVVKPGMVACPHCNTVYSTGRGICPRCKRAPTASGEYSGPKQNAPGAVAALVWGIVSLFICGIICGFVAIAKSNEAKKAIAANPRYGGAGMATAGMVLGILGLIGWAIVLFFKFNP